VASSNNKIHMKKILVPIDGSEYSLTAATYATELRKERMHSYFAYT
jgi:nucleotide-binding universal stress UspA family protein